MAIINSGEKTGKTAVGSKISGDKSGACRSRLEMDLFFSFIFSILCGCFVIPPRIADILSQYFIIHSTDPRRTVLFISLLCSFCFLRFLVFPPAGTSDFLRFVRLHETFITRHRCFLQRYFDHFKS